MGLFPARLSGLGLGRLRIAWVYLERPYIWGGNNPAGFDCSGLVIEALKSVGVLPRKGDWTAAGLFTRFGGIGQAAARPGDRVFWDEPIAHVEMIAHLGPPKLSIGASGGGSWALDVEQARKNVAEALASFVITCFELGTLDEVLKESGLEPQGSTRRKVSAGPGAGADRRALAAVRAARKPPPGMPRIAPLSWKRLESVFLAAGFRLVRQESRHRTYSKPRLLRPVVIPTYDSVEPFII